jgi:hypothetical protein
LAIQLRLLAYILLGQPDFCLEVFSEILDSEDLESRVRVVKGVLLGIFLIKLDAKFVAVKILNLILILVLHLNHDLVGMSEVPGGLGKISGELLLYHLGVSTVIPV